MPETVKTSPIVAGCDRALSSGFFQKSTCWRWCSELLIASKSKYFVKTDPFKKTNVVSEYARLIGDAGILPDLPFGSSAAVDS